MNSNDLKRKEIYNDEGSFIHVFFKNKKIQIRNDFFQIFKKFTNYTKTTSIIDIGTTPSLDDDQNIFLSNLTENIDITCLSNQDCSLLKKKYTNIKNFIISDGRDNNLASDTFEIVHSNATLEHVGSYQNQIKFIEECIRISKNKIFIQTPNRYFPYDFHASLPFIHMLPKTIHRFLLNLIGKKFYAKEDNLNLLSERDLRNICLILKIKKYKIIKYKLFSFTSNLILLIEK